MCVCSCLLLTLLIHKNEFMFVMEVACALYLLICSLRHWPKTWRLGFKLSKHSTLTVAVYKGASGCLSFFLHSLTCNVQWCVTAGGLPCTVAGHTGVDTLVWLTRLASFYTYKEETTIWKNHGLPMTISIQRCQWLAIVQPLNGWLGAAVCSAGERGRVPNFDYHIRRVVYDSGRYLLGKNPKTW